MHRNRRCTWIVATSSAYTFFTALDAMKQPGRGAPGLRIRVAHQGSVDLVPLRARKQIVRVHQAAGGIDKQPGECPVFFQGVVNATLWCHKRLGAGLPLPFLRSYPMKQLLFVVFTAATAALFSQTALAQRAAYDALVATHAQANGVPEALVHRVIVRESRYQPRLVGRGGTIGLMQIKLATARGLGYTGTAEGLRDPDTNLTYAREISRRRLSRRQRRPQSRRALLRQRILLRRQDASGFSRRHSSPAGAAGDLRPAVVLPPPPISGQCRAQQVRNGAEPVQGRATRALTPRRIGLH